jgi:hypothetical protein
MNDSTSNRVLHTVIFKFRTDDLITGPRPPSVNCASTNIAVGVMSSTQPLIASYLKPVALIDTILHHFALSKLPLAS